MKNIILISLVIIALSKVNEIEFGKEIPFDADNNNQFELTFPEDGNLFVYISFNDYDCLSFNIFFKYYEKKLKVSPPGIAEIIPFKKDYENKIILEFEGFTYEKGVIWMNPTNNEIKIDLDKTYEWKYDYHGIYYSNIKPNIYIYNIKQKITYTINKANKNALFEIKHNDKFEVIVSENNGQTWYYTSKHLYVEVCNGQNCQSGIKTFLIKKRKSYKINIAFYLYWGYGRGFKYTTYKYDYILPSFSFNFTEVDIEEDDEEEEEEEEKEIKKEEEKIEEIEEEKEEEIEEEIEEEKMEEKEEEKTDEIIKESSKQNEKISDSNFGSTILIAFFIILGILLIGGIGLFIYLIFRKNNRANEKYQFTENKEYELEKMDEGNKEDKEFENIESNMDDI